MRNVLTFGTKCPIPLQEDDEAPKLLDSDDAVVDLIGAGADDVDEDEEDSHMGEDYADDALDEDDDPDDSYPPPLVDDLDDELSDPVLKVRACVFACSCIGSLCHLRPGP